MERVPETGRSVIVANHPTGLADGSIVLAALNQVRTDIEIMANADACRVNPHFAEVIIPVEWVQDKRSIAKTRETLRRAGAEAARRAAAAGTAGTGDTACRNLRPRSRNAPRHRRQGARGL